jgi:hypothetical protein
MAKRILIMPMNLSDVTRILNYSDVELVQHAASEDLAVLVVANIRLRKSNERLTYALIALTIVLIIIAAFEAYRHW